MVAVLVLCRERARGDEPRGQIRGLALVRSLQRVEEDVGLLADRVASGLEAGRIARTTSVPRVGPETVRLVAVRIVALAVQCGVDRTGRVAGVVAREDPGPERVVPVGRNVRDLEVLERQRGRVLVVARDR